MKLYQILLLSIIAASIVPFAAIFALNTLFSMTIAYSLKTWLAALILVSIVGR